MKKYYKNREQSSQSCIINLFRLSTKNGGKMKKVMFLIGIIALAMSLNATHEEGHHQLVNKTRVFFGPSFTFFNTGGYFDYIKDNHNTKVEEDWTNGLNVGISRRITCSCHKIMAMEYGLAYRTLTWKEKYDISNSNDPDFCPFKNFTGGYVDFFIKLGWEINIQNSLYLEPYLTYSVSTLVYKNKELYDLDPYNHDASLSIGLEFGSLSFNYINMGIEYYHGFNDIFKYSTVVEQKAYNQGFRFMFSHDF